MKTNKKGCTIYFETVASDLTGLYRKICNSESYPLGLGAVLYIVRLYVLL